MKCFVIYSDCHIAKQTNKDGVWATTAQLYPGRDTCRFQFDQGHMTKNQAIAVLIFLSESLAI